MPKLQLKKSFHFPPCFNSGVPSLYSVNNSHFILCLFDGDLNFVNCFTREVEKTILCHGDPFTKFCHNNTALLTVNQSGRVRLWSLSDGKCGKELDLGLKDISFSAINHNNSVCALSTIKNTIYIVSLPDGKISARFGCKKAINKIIFDDLSHDHIFILTNEGPILVHSFKTNSSFELPFHYGAVTNLRFTADAIASCSRDKTVALWEKKEVLEKKGKSKPVKTFLVKESAEDFALDFKDTLNGFYFCGENGEIRYFDIGLNKITKKSAKISACRVLQLFPIKSSADQGGSQRLIGVTEDHHFVCLNGVQIEKAFVANLDTIEEIKCLAPNKSGDRAIVIDDTQIIKIIDLTTFEASLLIGHAHPVTAVALAPNGLILSGDKNGEIRVWDISNPKTRHSVISSATSIEASGDENRRIASIAAAEKFFCVLMADGRLFSWKTPLGVQKGAELGAPSQKTKAGAKGNSAALSGKGAHVAVGTMDAVVRAWDFPSFRNEVQLIGHKKAVWKVQFSPVEKLLISASSDKTVKLWSLSQKCCIKTFDGHNQSVYGVVFSPKGSHFASYGADPSLQIWSANSKKLTPDHSLAFKSQPHSADFFLGPNNTLSLITATNSDLSLWVEINKNGPEAHQEGTVAPMAIPNERSKHGELLKTENFERLVRSQKYGDALAFAASANASRLLLKLLIARPCLLETYKPSGWDSAALKNLLVVITQWMASSKTSNVAQVVIYWVFSSFKMDDIAKLCSRKHVSALILFCSRKMDRASDLKKSGNFLRVFERIGDENEVDGYDK